MDLYGFGFGGMAIDLRISDPSILSRIVERNVRIGEDSTGAEYAIRALTRLTELCRERVEVVSVRELNDQFAKSSDFLHALSAAIETLSNEFVIEWLDGYLQAMKYRVDNRQPRAADLSFVQQLVTAIMHGKVAAPVVNALDIPINPLALVAAVSLHTLSDLLEVPLSGDFGQSTPQIFLACLDTTELHRALAFGCRAMVDLYRFIEGGDKMKAELHVSILECAAGYDTLANLRRAAQESAEDIEIVDAEFEEIEA
ncbi:MAG: hypothetical protein Q7R79_02830 [bacterium]|nr:hypothetical protein [bacterium]